MGSPRRFLTAEWRWLAMVNYEADPAVLGPYVPADTELDSFQGRVYVSLVGFLFLNTRLLGVPVPWHRNFEEVNLRFYVRRETAGEVRRGVVFVREIVPRRAIAWTAQVLYGERYVALPMRHEITAERVTYSWKLGTRWNRMSVLRQGDPRPAEEGSVEQFITEHYWGYAAQRDGGCVEYQVEHPRWRLWDVQPLETDITVRELYGEEFVSMLAAEPASAFLADGSEVTVFRPARIG
jgi:uncharacterized protein